MNHLVDELLETKVDFIKLHLTLDLNEYMDTRHPSYNTLKQWMFSSSTWEKLILKIINGGKKPLLLLNDQKSVELAKHFQPELIEIHSVCLHDFHLLNKVRESFTKGVQIILGIGGSSLYEIENSIKTLKTQDIILMHGFQNYPTNYRDINFGKIRKIMRMYPEFEHGYADHCGWNEPNNILVTLMGAAIGMDFIEKHVTICYGVERCDWNSAISMEMLNQLIEKLQILNECNGDSLLSLNQAEKSYSIVGPMKKAAFFNTNLRKGEILKASQIAFKRCDIISSQQLTEIPDLIGRKTKSYISKDELINLNMLEL